MYSWNSVPVAKSAKASPGANKRKASVLKKEVLEKSDEEKQLIQVIYNFLSVPKLAGKNLERLFDFLNLPSQKLTVRP